MEVLAGGLPGAAVVGLREMPSGEHCELRRSPGGAVRLVQSLGSNQIIHAARAGAIHTLCGYQIGRSWRDHGRKYAKTPYLHVGCKHCRRVLGPMTDWEIRTAAAHALHQLGELVALAAET